MRRIVKIGFPIVCVVVIGGTFFALHKLEKKVENSKEKNTIKTSTNDNISNNIEKNIDSKKEVSFSTPIQKEVEKMNTELEEKAIEILKKTYTFNDDVYFTNEGIEDGNYIIAVRYKETTSAKIYYEIDIENEKVEVHY